MKRNIFKGLFPKMSILKKNKWLLLAIVVLVCLGLYFYSRKNKENFESKQILEDTSLKAYFLRDYNVNLTGVIIEEEEKLSDKFNLYLMNTIIKIKDTLTQSVAACKLTITDRGDTFKGDADYVIDFSAFKINEKETFKLTCDGRLGWLAIDNLNTFFTTLDKNTNQLLITNPGIEYVSGIRLERINIYLATGCTHSDNFKNYIEQGLTSKLSNTISVSIIPCETHTGDTKTKTKTNNQDFIAACKLGGYYKPTTRDSWDKPRVFPTIEYSRVIEISKAVDKATRGSNIVDLSVAAEKEQMVGKRVEIFFENTLGYNLFGKIDFYDPVTDRHLIKYESDSLVGGRAEFTEFKQLDLDKLVNSRSVGLKAVGEWKYYLDGRKYKYIQTQTLVPYALLIPIGTIIEVFSEDSTEAGQGFTFMGTEVVVVEHEVYWYDEVTGLYLITNNIKDQWEYVSLNVLKWRFKTEVLDNYYYTNKFDPKKKLDTAKTSFVNEDDGKIEYSETKILDWLSTIRESKSKANSNTKSSK